MTNVSLKAAPTENLERQDLFGLSEPGYYEDGKFGVRIESLVVVTKAETKVPIVRTRGRNVSTVMCVSSLLRTPPDRKSVV